MMASLPPISAITRLIQICPGCVLAASSLMRRPTSREPVKEMKRVLGCFTSTSPTAAPLPVSSVKLYAGKPASSSTSANLAPMVGVSLEGFDDGDIAGDQRRHGHPHHDGQREIPWRNHHPDAQRDVDHLVVLAGQLDHRLRTGEPLHFAGVVFAEIDGFGDVGVGFGPGFAGFVDQPGVEFELAMARRFAGALKSV
jgi:hypothetical protein